MRSFKSVMRKRNHKTTALQRVLGQVM